MKRVRLSPEWLLRATAVTPFYFDGDVERGPLMRETQRLDSAQLAALMSNDYDTLANKFADLLSFQELPLEVRQSIESHIRELVSRINLSDPNTIRTLYPVLRKLSDGGQ